MGSLPDDLNFMPSLSNGHLGFTVFGDAIYINGVYNGYKGNSRRARLPNWLNVTAHILNTQTNSYFQHNSIEYSMNLYEGVYEWVKEYKCLNLVLKQRFYAHRYFNRALVYETIVTRKTTSEPITIELHQNPGPNTQAFDVIFENSDANNIKMVKATTKILENEDFQPNRTSLYVAFSDNFQNDKKILKLNSDQKYLYYRFVLTADLKKSVALTEIQNVHSLHANDLLEKHTMKWQEFWNEFEINVEDNMELDVVNWMLTMKAIIFGILKYGCCQLIALSTYKELYIMQTKRDTPEQDFLGKVHILVQKPPIHVALKWPRRNSSFSIHISADIAVALKQFYATTYNHDWLCDTAWPLVREIAKFLQSRVTWMKKTKKFHIQNVMGPDEDHENVDDNVYTNVVFKQAFEFARFTHLTCDPNANVSSLDWLNIANNIFILYDNVLDYHPQHDGYKPGDQVKQADTILLGYPLQYPMQKFVQKLCILTRLNDLRMYENVTRRSGPAMTWSMFAINYLDVDLPSKAGEYFEKAYREYVRPQFKVWSETKLGFEGSANFLTGIGGFIQAIIHGYGGIRFQLENNLSKMIIKHTYLMNNTKQLTIKGIKFANSSFELIVKNGDNILTLLKLGNHPLEIAVGSDKASNLYDGFSIQFQTELIIIQTITKLAK
ncbi:Protein-glucosylgalactosylhydroxylysine glucosidase [Lucilia cuprina]|nr:Protein-glucosylgalactosylhydroxylysine glucosidase [Lucilia cuprina]